MKNNRRDFIKKSTILGAAGAIIPAVSFATKKELKTQSSIF